MSMVDYTTTTNYKQGKQPVAYHKAEAFAPINLKVGQVQVQAVSPPTPPFVQERRISPPGGTMQVQNSYPTYPSPQMLASSYSTSGARRTPSSATGYSYGSATALHPTRSASTSTVASSLGRSSSTRSGANVTGYVANMRKQKATVWCDRAQPEDRHTLAARRAAKNRAVMEIINSTPHGSVMNSASGKAKIRHAPKPGAIGYSPAEMVRGLAPQLSMAEADEEYGETDTFHQAKQRPGSGRSSINSSRRYTGPIGMPSSSSSSIYKEGSPRAGTMSSGFAAEEKTATGLSGGSRNSSLEESFGGLGSLTSTTAPVVPPVRNTADELRRRGSVDDRALQGATVRLFIANPDNDDSD